jgi:hypothetical protein
LLYEGWIASLFGNGVGGLDGGLHFAVVLVLGCPVEVGDGEVERDQRFAEGVRGDFLDLLLPPLLFLHPQNSPPNRTLPNSIVEKERV